MASGNNTLRAPAPHAILVLLIYIELVYYSVVDCLQECLFLNIYFFFDG